MVPPCSDRISRVPPYSRIKLLSTRTGLSPTLANFSKSFRFLQLYYWPLPRSLATTNGVSIDVLSSGYLDVSVPRVCLITLCIQMMILINQGVSPFGYLRINECSLLPAAFRSVPRPSSPLGAKASTICSYLLFKPLPEARGPAAEDKPPIPIRETNPGRAHKTLSFLRCKLTAITDPQSTHVRCRALTP